MKKKRSDKERLDWLSANPECVGKDFLGPYWFNIGGGPVRPFGKSGTLRQTIDAAMDAQEKGGGRGE